MKRFFINEKVLITEAFKPDEEIAKHTARYSKELNLLLDKPAGHSSVDWEARFSRVRTEETNLANFVADIMRTECQTDFTVANAGCLRANCVFRKGQFSRRFLAQVLPMTDHVVTLKLPG